MTHHDIHNARWSHTLGEIVVVDASEAWEPPMNLESYMVGVECMSRQLDLENHSFVPDYSEVYVDYGLADLDTNSDSALDSSNLVGEQTMASDRESLKVLTMDEIPKVGYGMSYNQTCVQE